jgi:hypothetical protein
MMAAPAGPSVRRSRGEDAELKLPVRALTVWLIRVRLVRSLRSEY